MTVAELISELKEYDQDLPVHFAYQYGDHWRTMVAPEVTEVSEEQVKYSSYHNTTALAKDQDDIDDSFIDVIILGSLIP